MATAASISSSRISAAPDAFPPPPTTRPTSGDLHDVPCEVPEEMGRLNMGALNAL